MEFGYQMGQGKAFVQGGGAYRDGDASRSWRMTARGYPPYSGVAFRAGRHPASDWAIRPRVSIAFSCRALHGCP